MPAPLSAGRRGLRRPPQVRAHASEQLVDGERLGHVVGRAGVQGLDLVVDAVQRGEHDHRERRLDRPDAAQHLDALAPGQQPVEDHEVDVGAHRLALALQAVGADVDLMALGAQRLLQELGDARLVLDQQDAHRPIVGRRLTDHGRSPYRGARRRSASAGHALTARTACSCSSGGIGRVDDRIAPVVERDPLGEQLAHRPWPAQATGSTTSSAHGRQGALGRRPAAHAAALRARPARAGPAPGPRARARPVAREPRTPRERVRARWRASGPRRRGGCRRRGPRTMSIQRTAARRRRGCVRPVANAADRRRRARAGRRRTARTARPTRPPGSRPGARSRRPGTPSAPSTTTTPRRARRRAAQRAVVERRGRRRPPGATRRSTRRPAGLGRRRRPAGARQRASASGDARRRSRGRPAPRTAPETVTSVVPGRSRRARPRNQAAPWRAMSARCASVSTFWTSVGRFLSPARTSGGLTVAAAAGPRGARPRAVSSPAT